MVSFGRRNNNNSSSRANKYATTPLDIPGILYTNRRPNKQEVDADGNLDDLIKQEIARYEELFHSNNDIHATQDDDDTLNDGSIYTSMQASAALFAPPMHRGASALIDKDKDQSDEEDEEDETMWGLENPKPIHQGGKVKQAAPTSLLKPEETAAANACNITKPRSGRKIVVPPIPVIVSVDHASITRTTTTPAKVKTEVKAATTAAGKKSAVTTPLPTTTTTTKKNKFKPSFSKRLLGKAGGSVPVKHVIPSTPRTQASTPSISTGSKMKLFSPVKFLKASKFSKQQQQQQQKHNHQNLLLASMATRAPEPPQPKRGGGGGRRAPPPPTVATAQKGHHQRRRPPTPPPSPPPPIQEIRHTDGGSVVSAQSSLTDALDAWFVSSSPPKIIGGEQQDVSPFKSEPYEGGLTPYNNNDGIGGTQTENGTGGGVSSSSSNNDDDDELLSTEKGLFFHNHQGKALSPVVAPVSDSTKVTQDNDEMQVVKILGLEEDKANSNVKRDLFGANISDDGGGDAPLEESQVPQEQEYVEEEDDEPFMEARSHDDLADEDDLAAIEELPIQNQQKSSKFKRFLNKLVTSPTKMIKQVEEEAQVQKWKEQQLEAYEAQQIEEQRLEQEETKRIELMRQQELERQRNLELESRAKNEPSSQTSKTGGSSTSEDDNSTEDCTPRLATRSFSLMSGQMKPSDQPTSQSSLTADITAFQTVQTAPSSSGCPSIQDSPTPTTYSDDEAAVTAAAANTVDVTTTPKSKSSYLVNFQFHRQDDVGGRSYTMAYAVDYSSSTGDIKWKEIVNDAWKDDRRLVKSGVFSAIQADTIKKIRNGDLEMRFELPFWGKHASQTLGGKSLDVLLDVVGPQRPVKVTITLEEPAPVATGVEDVAPECLF